MRRRKVVWTATTLVVVGALAVAVLTRVGGSPQQVAAGNDLPAATAVVAKTDLVQSTHVSGTLSYGVPKTLAAGGSGTVTWLAPEGKKLKAGSAAYRIDNVPVILWPLSLPLYRPLKYGTEGADVLQLEKYLVAKGYLKIKANKYYGWATVEAVEDWQDDLGQPETGSIDPKFFVLAQPETPVGGKSGIRVAQHGVAVGDKVGPGKPVFTYSGTAPLVVVGLDVAKQHLVKKGIAATVTLPAGQSTKATVTSVSTVATVPKGDDKATIPVVLTLTKPSAAGGLDSAPVDVALVSSRRDDVLAVPVPALVALAEGGYGVQVVSGGSATFVAVKTGMFADGKVEISGAGIAAGTVVGVPS